MKEKEREDNGRRMLVFAGRGKKNQQRVEMLLNHLAIK